MDDEIKYAAADDAKKPPTIDGRKWAVSGASGYTILASRGEYKRHPIVRSDYLNEQLSVFTHDPYDPVYPWPVEITGDMDMLSAASTFVFVMAMKGWKIENDRTDTPEPEVYEVDLDAETVVRLGPPPVEEDGTN